jgi:17beta-estradiol 17-dehydrogenase / very-long-chain 3-oxoacyl-CoA reductase
LNLLFSEKTFGVETRIIVADFSYGEEEYQRIFAQIEDLDIGILSEFFINILFALFYDNYQIIMTLNFMSSVNNVGISLGLPNRLERISRKHIWALMMVNTCAAVSMAHQVLPKMKSNKRGLIVNISSASSLLPTPYANLYGASKVTTAFHFTFEIYF